MTISDIADVTAGLHVSPGEATNEGYQPLSRPLAYLQLSDFNDDGLKLLKEVKAPTYLSAAPLSVQRRLLEPGQVLLPAKGGRLVAAVVAEDWLPAIASSSFFVLTVLDPARCLPEFLALVLNLPTTREELRRRLSATIIAPSANRRAVTVSALNRRDLLTLPLLTETDAPDSYWPSVQEQHQAVTLYSLWLQEKELATRYLHTREQLIITSLITSLKG